MAAKTEMKKTQFIETKAEEPAEENKEKEGSNKAWDLAQKLKARMTALHGNNSRRKIVEQRKTNFKKHVGIADSDETPDEFDPNDSDYNTIEEDSDDSSD